MGQSQKAWTQAIEQLLSDGAEHMLEDVLAVGAAEVSEERALQEMGSKQAGQDNARRIAIGKRNVAMQAVTGMVRFGKAKYTEGKKKIQWVGADSTSIGDLKFRVEELERQLAELIDWKQSAQAELDRLEAAEEEDEQAGPPGQQFLTSVGVEG